MILRVLPIHVPPCYDGGYLKPTPLKPYVTYGHHHSTSIIMRKCKDNSHPQEKPQSTSKGGRGEGGQGGYITLGGWGGLPNLDHMEPFSCRNKKPIPSNVIGSMMIIRVLPIHVPPCYEGGYLRPTPLKPYVTYDDHLVWPIHVPRRCRPLITPHLSLWGTSTTRATIPTHKKNHNPHPQGEREGGQDGYITLGVGGACQTWIIYISSHGGTLPLVGEVDLGWALHWPNALHFSVSLLTDGEPGQKSKCHLQFWCHQACIFICIYIYT